jgi:predicted RNase H-like HicB family nuclease
MIVAPSSISTNRTSSPPVLVTQRADGVWIAKLLTWADFSVEGNSREDALSKLDQHVKAQLADGEIAYLDLPLLQAKNPWLAIAGKYQDDPNWEEYQTAIAEARQAANESEGICLEGDMAK